MDLDVFSLPFLSFSISFFSYFFSWGRGRAVAKHLLKDKHGDKIIISVGCNNDGTVSG